MLLTGSMVDVRVMTNEQRPHNLPDTSKKRDTVTRQQKGCYRTSLIIDNNSSGFGNLKDHKWSSLRLPKENEKNVTWSATKKTLSVNGGIEFSGMGSNKMQSPTPQVKEVWLN